MARRRDDAHVYFTGKGLLGERLAAWEAGGRQNASLLDQGRERITEWISPPRGGSIWPGNCSIGRTRPSMPPRRPDAIRCAWGKVD